MDSEFKPEDLLEEIEKVLEDSGVEPEQQLECPDMVSMLSELGAQVYSYTLENAPDETPIREAKKRARYAQSVVTGLTGMKYASDNVLITSGILSSLADELKEVINENAAMMSGQQEEQSGKEEE